MAVFENRTICSALALSLMMVALACRPALASSPTAAAPQQPKASAIESSPSAPAGRESTDETDSHAATDPAPTAHLKESCSALQLADTTHRQWLHHAILRAMRGAALTKRKLLEELRARIESSEARTRPTSLGSIVLQEVDGSNASLGMRLLPTVLVEPIDTVSIWTKGIESDRPTPGAKGCWAIIRTGIRDIAVIGALDETRLVARYRYSIAFAADEGRVSTMPLPVWFDGIDAHNMLTIQDLDGDGFEEAIYIAADGWFGQAHESQSGGSTTFMLKIENGALRERPPFARNSAYASSTWALGDVNGDRRLDMVLADGVSFPHPCPAPMAWSEYVGAALTMALIQNDQGVFTFEHPDAHRHIQAQCGERDEPITTMHQVLCARVLGDCTSNIRRRIREHNAPWDCRLARRGADQVRENAKEEYQAMRAAAAWRPMHSVAPLCNR
jgi:hypothetical protein